MAYAGHEWQKNDDDVSGEQKVHDSEYPPVLVLATADILWDQKRFFVVCVRFDPVHRRAREEREAFIPTKLKRVCFWAIHRNELVSKYNSKSEESFVIEIITNIFFQNAA